MSATLINILNQLTPVPEQGLDELVSRSKPIQVEANQVLISCNSKPQYLYAIEQGLLRAVFVTQDGKEFSKEFYWENDIIFVMRYLMTKKPLPYSIETVEPCTLYQMPIDIYQKLIDSKTVWLRYHQKHIEHQLLFKEIKEELLLLHSNEQKVEKVYELFPHFVCRVPATLIASYLGLSPVSVSRIKKRLGL
ncbi:Crp/Fnr family transcriptional regulator [Spartinivicinus poritis]|uniref:Crp/Fnr family transcriptional regulator n=1 Tax=Spartinivicinus poritis TaxID=2994640 RepID=A0ABT5UAM9_9GAMM|nr:Crp/Fnr family transcriptional regulator [Spartinivicinus sp. A2-2]MDE1463433.1 Crp/Fnr family transcriptional regulator [Spartinivicinus sp. A2-2]